MSFNTTYPVGGVIDEIKKIHFPPNVFPRDTFLFDYTKGFRLDIPAQIAAFPATFTLPWDAHLISASVVCSGYFDGDFWELTVGTSKRIETCYTKGVPETVRMDTTFPTFASGSVITVTFQNASGTSKQVYINVKLLHG